MSKSSGNRITVTIHMDPETYRAMNDYRNPYISTSAFCAMIIEEVVSGNKRQEA
jgi:hypothetical protein